MMACGPVDDSTAITEGICSAAGKKQSEKLTLISVTWFSLVCTVGLTFRIGEFSMEATCRDDDVSVFLLLMLLPLPIIRGCCGISDISLVLLFERVVRKALSGIDGAVDILTLSIEFRHRSGLMGGVLFLKCCCCCCCAATTDGGTAGVGNTRFLCLGGMGLRLLLVLLLLL